MSKTRRLNPDTVIRTYEYKLRANKSFIVACEKALEDARFVYNCALEHRISLYRQASIQVGYFEQSHQLTEARQGLLEVRGCLRAIQEDALNKVDEAFKGFFRRAAKGQTGFPRFKAKGRCHTFSMQIGHNDRCPLKGDRLRVPGVGSCRVRLSRPFQGTVKRLRITRRADGWYVLLACETSKPEPLPKTGQSVGVDVGISAFATLSTGEVIQNPHYHQRAESKLARLQRRASRKQLGSRNREKANQKTALAYLKVANARKDFHHKVAKDLVGRFDRIAVEDLNIKAMGRSRSLGKAIYDVAWGRFFLITKVKAESAGRLFEKVPAAYTSQTCSKCGCRQKMPLHVRTFNCASCGYSQDRDHNAAINIRRSTPKSKSVESSQRPTLKQKQARLFKPDAKVSPLDTGAGTHTQV